MEAAQNASRKNRDLRTKTNAEVIQFGKAVMITGSQRAAAKKTGIPRSTAQSRIERRKKRTLPEPVQAFLDTTEGMEFLHRLIVAIELVITQIAGGGIRVVQLFLELTELDQWVASSFGSVKARIETMEKNIIRFGTEQERKLGSNMRNKKITACLDETFPSGVCLVAIEPISNFILLETLAKDRTCETWKNAMDNRLEQLPVEIDQVAGDGAKALTKFAKVELGAHYSPDLFHIQQDISRATAASLSRKTASCEKNVEVQSKLLDQINQAERDYSSLTVKPVGRPTDYTTRKSDALMAFEQSKLDLKQAKNRQKVVKQSIKNIGDLYHPFNMSTGAKRTPNRFEKAISKVFETIEFHAEEAGLSENNMKKIEKAARAISSMKDTISYFWTSFTTLTASLKFAKKQKAVFEKLLLPITYIGLQIPKARDAEHKRELKSTVARLKDRLDCNETWNSISKHEKERYQQKAIECAQVFQRSTSNVEGRNGYLSLQHHAFRQMNPRKLEAATVIHNYFIRRLDGSTAAERFFEQPHDDLFKWLVQQTDYPAQSRVWSSRIKVAA